MSSTHLIVDLLTVAYLCTAKDEINVPIALSAFRDNFVCASTHLFHLCWEGQMDLWLLTHLMDTWTTTEIPGYNMRAIFVKAIINQLINPKVHHVHDPSAYLRPITSPDWFDQWCDYIFIAVN